LLAIADGIVSEGTPEDKYTLKDAAIGAG